MLPINGVIFQYGFYLHAMIEQFQYFNSFFVDFYVYTLIGELWKYEFEHRNNIVCRKIGEYRYTYTDIISVQL